MKLTLFLSILTISQLWATETYSQMTKLTLKLEDVKVSDVLKDIENQSEFFFLYSPKLIDVERKVNIDARKEPIKDILSNIFDDKVKFVVYDKQVILTPSDLAIPITEMQQSKITGKVTDKNGDPITGANVVITGTTIGALTDVTGKYTIEVPPGSKSLTFSFIGMKPQEIIIGSSNVIDVVMADELIGLNEVVVTALGIKREEKELGYSVQKVSGESLQKVSGVEAATSLTGKVAGLLVSNSTDFGTAPVLTIRGENPLIVIDGVAYANKTIGDISSEDIESMSVLKGATASALYGYRGANGAILITTKNGSSNASGMTVDFTTNTMFAAGFLAIPKKQSVYGRGDNNTYDINSTSSWGTVMDGTIRTQWDPFLKDYSDYPYLPIGKNNFRDFLVPGYVTNNNLNFGYKNKMLHSEVRLTGHRIKDSILILYWINIPILLAEILLLINSN